MSSEVDFQELIYELASIRAVDFRGYKPSSLQRRVRKRMGEVGVSSYRQYLDYFRAHPEEVNELLSAVLINVSEFFRDPPAWQALRERVLPLLLERLDRKKPLRVWSAGCSTGEEPYSVAILLSEYFGEDLANRNVKIYATDPDEEAITVARRGEYAVDKLRNLSEGWRAQYFEGSQRGMVRIRRDLRRLVIFGKSNLVADAPVSHVHLLVCRKVLITRSSYRVRI